MKLSALNRSPSPDSQYPSALYSGHNTSSSTHAVGARVGELVEQKKVLITEYVSKSPAEQSAKQALPSQALVTPQSSTSPERIKSNIGQSCRHVGGSGNPPKDPPKDPNSMVGASVGAATVGVNVGAPGASPHMPTRYPQDALHNSTISAALAKGENPSSQ